MRKKLVISAIAVLLLLGIGTASCKNQATTKPTTAAPKLTAINVSGKNTGILIGLTQQFTATGVFDDGSRRT